MNATKTIEGNDQGNTSNNSNKKNNSLWERLKIGKCRFCWLAILTALIVTHSTGATHEQITLMQQAGNASTKGSAMHLEVSTQGLTQFLELALSSLSILAFIALVMERALEVFVISIHGPERIKLEAEIRSLTQQAKTDSNESKRLEKTEALKKHKGDTKVEIQLIALTIGVLLGLSGVRILEPVFTLDSVLAMPQLQQWLFRCLDIVVTGLAVAGGSDGIHLISVKVGNALGKQKKASTEIEPEPGSSQ